VSKKKISIYVCAIALLFWTLFPIYTLVLTSIEQQVELVSAPPHWIPESPTASNYLQLLGITPAVSGMMMGTVETLRVGLLNSIIIALAVTGIATLVSAFAGFAFGRYRFRGKMQMLFAILFSRLLPSVAMIIPFFYLFNQLGLLATQQALIITYLSFSIPLATWVLLGFFATLPSEMIKSARIDGCSRTSSILRIAMPMSRAGIVAVAILVFIGCWNEFFFALMLNGGTPAQTIPPAVASLFGVQGGINQLGQPAIAAATAISLAPVLVLGLIFQRYVTRLRIVDPVTIALELPEGA